MRKAPFRRRDAGLHHSVLWLLLLSSAAFHSDTTFAWVNHQTTQNKRHTCIHYGTVSEKTSSASSPLPRFEHLEEGSRKQPRRRNYYKPSRRIQSTESISLPARIPKLSEVLEASAQNDAEDKKPTKTKKTKKTPPPTSTPRRNKVVVADDHAVEQQLQGEPWKADYKTSLETQSRIKSAARWNGSPVARATRVLQTFLSTPPTQCNSVNLVCALTLSAKLIDREITDEYRSLFFQTIHVLDKVLRNRDLSARQLCNTVWAIAKHYDRDERILPPRIEQAALSSSAAAGRAEKWSLVVPEDSTTGAQKVDALVDEIALQLISVLENDSSAAKEGEMCMATWAYGVLRPRGKPPGWKLGPQVGEVERKGGTREGNLDFVKFEQWIPTAADDECTEFDPPGPTDELFDSIAYAFTETKREKDGDVVYKRLRTCEWRELANLAWAFANHGRSCSVESEELMLAIASEAGHRLAGQSVSAPVLSRDIAQIVWSLGTLQADNFRLAEGLISVVDALITHTGVSDVQSSDRSLRPLRDWSCADLVQVVLSMAHGRLDELSLLNALYEEASTRLEEAMKDNRSSLLSSRETFFAWEVSILLWAQARLYLKSSEGDVFGRFPSLAIKFIHQCIKKRPKSLTSVGIGAQEQANIVWALTVLEEYENPATVDLISLIYDESAKECQSEGVIQLEHAHQLWQALFLLEEECPKAVESVQDWFYNYLRDKWVIEKSRTKVSSARHRSISQTLNMMGVRHKNEHDEDIDVAIILKPQASWSHQTGNRVSPDVVRLAVEFDGPNHFTRQKPTTDGSKPKIPRTLGHSVLKYRLLKKQGWTVVRVPYYEFDKIPFWASMERQRYLQRLLKTHGNLKFSEVDVSEYKPLAPVRTSRFD